MCSISVFADLVTITVDVSVTNSTLSRMMCIQQLTLQQTTCSCGSREVHLFWTISVWYLCSCGDGWEVHFFLDCFCTVSLLVRRWPRSALCFHMVSLHMRRWPRSVLLLDILWRVLLTYRKHYQYKILIADNYFSLLVPHWHSKDSLYGGEHHMVEFTQHNCFLVALYTLSSQPSFSHILCTVIIMSVS